MVWSSGIHNERNNKHATEIDIITVYISTNGNIVKYFQNNRSTSAESLAVSSHVSIESAVSLRLRGGGGLAGRMTPIGNGFGLMTCDSSSQAISRSSLICMKIRFLYYYKLSLLNAKPQNLFIKIFQTKINIFV